MKTLPPGWKPFTHYPWSEAHPLYIGIGGVRRVWQIQDGSDWIACDETGAVIGGVSSPQKFENMADAIAAAEGRA